MQKILLSAVFLSSLVSIPALAVVIVPPVVSANADFECQWIDGYFRKDGTYVEGHWRGCNYND